MISAKLHATTSLHRRIAANTKALAQGNVLMRKSWGFLEISWGFLGPRLANAWLSEDAHEDEEELRSGEDASAWQIDQ